MEKTPRPPELGPNGKPVRTWRVEEDRPSKTFQWLVNLPDKFTSRKFNVYQFTLVVILRVLFYFLVLERFAG